MEYLENVQVIVVAPGPRGEAIFLDAPRPCTMSVPGAIDVALFWSTDPVTDLSTQAGQVPTDMGFPPPGATRLGIMCFPPRSAGKLNMSDEAVGRDALVDDRNPSMHRSDTIDYEVIISGKVDIVLPSGDRRTLGPGSCLVMGGVMHAWENHYDEPCVYVGVIVGAERLRPVRN